MVFIIPGIETAAPERTETSSGFLSSPNFLPNSSSSVLTLDSTSAIKAEGITLPAL